MPAIGTPRGSQPRSAVSAHGPDESTSVGSTSGGTSSRAHMRSSQSTLARFRQSVREALLTSVACTRPRVNFHKSHVSTVPKASWPRAARRRASGAWSRIVLRDFRVAARAHGAFGVDDECRRAGRPLVEREHEAGRHRSGRLSYGLLKEAGAMRLVRRLLVTLLLLAIPAAGAPPGHAAPEGQLTWAAHFALAPTR